MSSIQELAAVDILCSDKTGTLTLNKLTIATELVETADKNITVNDCLQYAAYASRTENPDAIDEVVLRSLPEGMGPRKDIEPVHFTPFDPQRKRTEMLFKDTNGNYHIAAKGLPNILVDVCGCSADMKAQVTKIVDDLATRGLRTLGVARADCKGEDDANPEWGKERK